MFYWRDWLAASENGFTCHYGRSQRTPVRENPTTGLYSTNRGSSHVPHVWCKPEGIRPGGTWWIVYGFQPTHTYIRYKGKNFYHQRSNGLNFPYSKIDYTKISIKTPKIWKQSERDSGLNLGEALSSFFLYKGATPSFHKTQSVTFTSFISWLIQQVIEYNNSFNTSRFITNYMHICTIVWQYNVLSYFSTTIELLWNQPCMIERKWIFIGKI